MRSRISSWHSRRSRELEPDAALGNGGLGRLAACLLDSMATLSIPGYGYGIRYEYGLFFQRIVRGIAGRAARQLAALRQSVRVSAARMSSIRSGLADTSCEYPDERGRMRLNGLTPTSSWRWRSTCRCLASRAAPSTNMRLVVGESLARVQPPGLQRRSLRRAVERKTGVGEPVESPLSSRHHALRSRAQAEAAVFFRLGVITQDILRRYPAAHHPLDELPDRVAIQLNDTHPSLAMPELMRLLLDLHHLDWDRAWDLTRRTFRPYTNHTLMPEALETWPVSLFRPAAAAPPSSSSTKSTGGCSKTSAGNFPAISISWQARLADRRGRRTPGEDVTSRLCAAAIASTACRRSTRI